MKNIDLLFWTRHRLSLTVDKGLNSDTTEWDSTLFQIKSNFYVHLKTL